ncbi:unnamed protein product, partial [marine sediment metagenome]
ILENKVTELIKKIDNHCRAHLIDRIIQALSLTGMAVILFLLKIVIFK